MHHHGQRWPSTTTPSRGDTRRQTHASKNDRVAITVVAADSHPLFLASLTSSIAAHRSFRLLATAQDGTSVLELIRTHRPDVAVADVGLCRMDACQLLDAITAERLPTKVLVLSGQTDPDVVRLALASGASGYLSKEATERQVHEAIIEVASGLISVAPELQTDLMEQLHGTAAHRPPVLSGRELETLRLASYGLTINNIAGQLALSPHTIHTNLRRIYDKLNVNNQAGAIGKAMRQGILQ